MNGVKVKVKQTYTNMHPYRGRAYIYYKFLTITLHLHCPFMRTPPPWSTPTAGQSDSSPIIAPMTQQYPTMTPQCKCSMNGKRAGHKNQYHSLHRCYDSNISLTYRGCPVRLRMSNSVR